MAPPRNTRRRNALADAVIEVLGTAGIHKLSHRAADDRAGLPPGTAANYFPRRDDLLAAAAERVAELALAEMAAADQAAVPGADGRAGATDSRASAADGRETLARLIGGSLYAAAAVHRTRYLAAYELALESTRHPELAVAMSRLSSGALDATVAEHRELGLPTTPAQVQALIALYNGTLLSLAVAPAGAVTPEAAITLARCLVTGVLGTDIPAAPK